MSIDGFVAGPHMSEQKPFGNLQESVLSRGMPDAPEGLLHRWMCEEPEKHLSEIVELNSVAGAYIMGRNIYGLRGESYHQPWKCW